MIVRRSVFVLWIFLFVIGGCTDCRRDAPSSERGDEAETSSDGKAEPTSNRPPDPMYGRRIERANKLMEAVVEGARRHYASATDPGEATFPGGTGVEWSTIEEPPETGATYRWMAGERPDTGEADGAAGSDSAPLGEVFGLEPGVELPVRLVYRTGDRTGHEATATVRAVADFDPSSEADHTIEQELGVDPKTGGVNVFPPLTRYRWK